MFNGRKAAVKTVVDGICFDSKKEARRYAFLREREKLGEVSEIQVHVKFVLQEGFVAKDGKKIRPITYTPDFLYREYGDLVAEDVKGWKEPVYLLKKKLFMYKFPMYTFIES